MKKPGVSDTVFQKLFGSTPKQNGPATWTQHVQRNLVPEVREEVQRYFGRIDCLEAQYPGLDYTFAPHRRRLAAFQWHRRLFRAFEELHLTSDEILALCNWEGTRAAKERFERESRTTIDSTTLDGVEAAPASDGPKAVFHDSRESSQTTPQPVHTPRPSAGSFDDVSEEADNEESVGVQLNHSLIAAAAARDRGEVAQFDAQWEQWMKDAIERNDLTPETIRTILRYGLPEPQSPTGDAINGSASGVQPSTTNASNPIDEHAAPQQPSVASLEAQYTRLRDAVDELGTASARIAADTGDMLRAETTSRARTTSSTHHARVGSLIDEPASPLDADMQNLLSRRRRTETAR